MGWSFDDWARENGLTSSGARIDKSENLCPKPCVNQEPQQKKRCLDVVNFFENIFFLLFGIYFEWETCTAI